MMSVCSIMACITQRLIFQGILGMVSLGALAFALIAEHGFGLVPCAFCVYERWVFVAILVVAIADRTFLKQTSGQLAAWLQITILFLGCAITLYHVGMEMQWWKGPASCTGPISATDGPVTVEQVQAKLLAQAVVRCDKISWAIFGFLQRFGICYYKLFCCRIPLFLYVPFHLVKIKHEKKLSFNILIL